MKKNTILSLFAFYIVLLLTSSSCGVFNKSRCGDCPKFNSIEQPTPEEIPC